MIVSNFPVTKFRRIKGWDFLEPIMTFDFPNFILVGIQSFDGALVLTSE